jgi:hypothetical protein
MRAFSLAFTAGAVGALANSLLLWLFGAAGLHKLIGVALAPGLSPGWLYPRLVWGGLWGLLFALPVLTRRPPGVRSLIFSLGPSLAAMFYFLPVVAQKGWLGLEFGAAMPALILFYNAVWAIVTGVWFERSRP